MHNPQSFPQLATLANAVRASGPKSGRSGEGLGRARRAGLQQATGRRLGLCAAQGRADHQDPYTGNAATHPDAFGLISWNEIAEGTYVDPMTRYGYQDLNALSSLIR